MLEEVTEVNGGGTWRMHWKIGVVVVVVFRRWQEVAASVDMTTFDLTVQSKMTSWSPSHYPRQKI